jgi:hypothetical protein
MKTFNSFISEARNAAGVRGALSRAADTKKKNAGKSDEGIVKYKALKQKENDLDAKPDSTTGKYAKEYDRIEKAKIKILTDYNILAGDSRLK